MDQINHKSRIIGTNNILIFCLRMARAQVPRKGRIVTTTERKQAMINFVDKFLGSTFPHDVVGDVVRLPFDGEIKVSCSNDITNTDPGKVFFHEHEALEIEE